MPLVAEMVDELRATFGTEVVNRCITRGQHLRRQHAALVAQGRRAAADAWLAAEQQRGGWFGATEAGRCVGVLGMQQGAGR